VIPEKITLHMAAHKHAYHASHNRGPAGAEAPGSRRLNRVSEQVDGSAAKAEELPDTGPIIGWGQTPLTAANEVIDLALQPPCIGDDFMCEAHVDSLSPQTGYRVCSFPLASILSSTK
jgi:hypothetical protein